MYPLSSKKASARKSMKMLGRNVIIVPTPLMMPSIISEITISFADMLSSQPPRLSESQPIPSSNSAFIASPTKKVRKNTTAIMPKNTGMPHTLCVNTESSFSVNASLESFLNSTSSTISSIKSYFSFIMRDS